MTATSLVIELDVIQRSYEVLVAEVEFPDEEAALAFTPPVWFGRDVTFTGEYQNKPAGSEANVRRSHFPIVCSGESAV